MSQCIKPMEQNHRGVRESIRVWVLIAMMTPTLTWQDWAGRRPGTWRCARAPTRTTRCCPRRWNAGRRPCWRSFCRATCRSSTRSTTATSWLVCWRERQSAGPQKKYSFLFCLFFVVFFFVERGGPLSGRHGTPAEDVADRRGGREARQHGLPGHRRLARRQRSGAHPFWHPRPRHVRNRFAFWLLLGFTGFYWVLPRFAGLSSASSILFH